MLTGLALLLAVLALEPPGRAAEPEPTPTPAPAIELPSLARKLEADLARVKSLEKAVEPSAMFREVERELPATTVRMTSMEAELLAANPDGLTFREIDVMRIGWLGVDGALSRWETALEHDAKVVDDASRELARIESAWREVLEAEWHEQIPPPLVEKITALLSRTAGARKAMVSRIGALLVVQDQVSSGRGRVRDALDRTFRLSSDVSEQLFAIEQNTLWSALAQARAPRGLGAQAVESWRGAVAGLARDLSASRRTLLCQLALFAGLAAAAVLLARRAIRDPRADDVAKDAAAFLDRPAAASGALAIFATFFIYPATAVPVRDAALTLLLVPYARLVPKVVAPTLRREAYGLGALFLLDRIHDFTLPHSLLQRLTLLLLGILGVAGWAWAHRATRRAAASGAPVWELGWRVIARAAMACLAGAVLANVMGNVSLAEQLTVIAVKGTFAGGMLYILARVLESYYVLLLRYLAVVGARFVVRNAALLERRGRKTIRVAALGAWIVFVLWIMRIIEQSGAAIVALFGKRWTLGHIEIGLSGIVAFATALTIGIVTARIVRFILDEAVFPRMSMPRGVPAAISTTAGYLIVVTGVVMAFFAAGLEMSQFTFLAGAFGVGIGFGLQNVVNNFVSGLILLYERPIQVGDVLTVGTFQGRVQRIGIRSSTLATFDGAEVIVPNATLIATDVVNWTLTDRLRRVEIAVGASYGSDPRAVLDLLLKVARAHPSVLSSPAPNALFMGFGESSLDFELRFWTPEYDTYLLVASDLRTAIVAAFREAGIEIPFPQRDVHVRSVAPPGGGALGTG